MIWNRGAYHATKAALAGLRSGSIRSAGCRYGYDCTAYNYRLNLAPEPAHAPVAEQEGDRRGRGHAGRAALRARARFLRCGLLS